MANYPPSGKGAPVDKATTNLTTVHTCTSPVSISTQHSTSVGATRPVVQKPLQDCTLTQQERKIKVWYTNGDQLGLLNKLDELRSRIHTADKRNKPQLIARDHGS